MQIYMIKHTVCCSLQTSKSRPYSRGTSSQTVPSSSTKSTKPVWPNLPTNDRVHPHSWQQITDQPHRTKQSKTWIHTCAHTQMYKTKHTYTNKARATHVMLARASTTSLACAETPCGEQNLANEIIWIRNEVKSGDQAFFEMKSIDWACGVESGPSPKIGHVHGS